MEISNKITYTISQFWSNAHMTSCRQGEIPAGISRLRRRKTSAENRAGRRYGIRKLRKTKSGLAASVKRLSPALEKFEKSGRRTSHKGLSML